MPTDYDESLDFSDLTLIELPVQIGSGNYILREASGDVTARFKNALLKGTRFGASGKPESVGNVADLDFLLLEGCLRTENDKPVSMALLRSWPHRVTEKLVERCKKISRMDEGADTVESVTAQIEVLQKQLEKLQQEPEGNDD